MGNGFLIVSKIYIRVTSHKFEEYKKKKKKKKRKQRENRNINDN